jgi:hypothetical protein
MELHRLTPLGILHIASFVTLGKAYMGIKPHFDMWNYFFHAQLLQDSGAQVAVFGGVDIYVKSGPGVNSYFHLPLSGSTDGWRKVWFFLRNDADVPLPMFTGTCPVCQPN